MRKMKMIVLLMGALLFTGIGAVSVSAADMKCAAGKCGNAKMAKPACKSCDNKPANCKCSDKSKCTCKNTENCTCNQGKKAMKCSSGKCGNGKAPAKQSKCGTGKCGSN